MFKFFANNNLTQSRVRLGFVSFRITFRTCWVTLYAVLAVNVDDRKCQRFLEERPLVRYFFSTHPEKTKNNWPLSTIDIEREKICQWSFFSSFFQRLYKHSSGTLNQNTNLFVKSKVLLELSIWIFALKISKLFQFWS